MGKQRGAYGGQRYRQERQPIVRRITTVIAASLCISAGSISNADEDSRQWVEFPEMMRQHMMSNMRDHLVTINEILEQLSNGRLDQAAEVAETKLGMSSLESHGASHMARFMPEGMRRAGTRMHRAASRFALKAQEGEVLPAYKALSEVTSACVACHAGYRIR
jgi:hypothetical protein